MTIPDFLIEDNLKFSLKKIKKSSWT